MLITAFVFMRDNGDGSASPVYCSSLEEAQRLEEIESEYGNFCDAVEVKHFTVENGVLKPTYGWGDYKEDE